MRDSSFISKRLSALQRCRCGGATALPVGGAVAWLGFGAAMHQVPPHLACMAVLLFGITVRLATILTTTTARWGWRDMRCVPRAKACSTWWEGWKE
ncbi:hypothetical protein BIFGAL_04413 [Bifidobacterium gallicum DSM 20093 = LMG 11596]|uniref:Uncharacterized protein n=1 Tax=Bifidobacterium gallicum DSM 20093 = LMG 11596 TaxID=561180 RepID=D1NX05_9BIFI|nr:hypothetical protein BIFGAL_04413 [Bifidobacterium gallicum DSM 20093 = LMG 11596]